MTMRRAMRVLIVDDSAVVRKLLNDALSAEPEIEVVGTAGDVFVARDLILRHDPDVMTLDVEMPRMDGISFLRRVMEYRPMPVIVVSSITQRGSLASVEALRIGAVDVIPKPGGPGSVGAVASEIARRIRAIRASGMKIKAFAPAAPAPPMPATARIGRRPAGALLLIGASTGGPQAIESLLSRMPADLPPTLIVQHMPPHFTAAFAERLDRSCPMHVREAAGGERLEPGCAYVAPGGRHLIVERAGLALTTALRDGPPLHDPRPAVDVLFHSAARLAGVPTVALVLTGMGQDGAAGLLALRQAGAETIAEDEQSCVVFGMPREAIARGAARHVSTLLRMPALIVESLDRLAAAA
ncbi:MAG: chemotaxis response regulator protein-glutamate methylesterase [Acidobacteria bacterium]|nr:chemotaxis response regulator protein-glutamate methylesterase [Acidobacteriota bacterium]